MNRGLTTSELAKLIFDIKNKNELRKKDSYIREKLKKFIKRGVIVEYTDNPIKKKKYKLAGYNRVLFGIGELKLVNRSESINLKIPLGEIIVVKENSKSVLIEKI